MSWPYPPRTRRRTATLAVCVAAVVVAAVVLGVAIVVRHGGGSNDSTAKRASFEQTRPVTVTGKPLPKQIPMQKDVIGTPLPQIAGASFDGTPVVIKPGRRTMIVITSHWNNGARENIDALAQYAKSGAKPDFDIIVISTEAKPSQPDYPPSKQFTDAANPYPYPVLADSDDSAAAAALGFQSFPWIVMADEQGRLVFRFPIPLDANFMNVTAPTIFADPSQG